jgi:hypothetical protein
MKMTKSLLPVLAILLIFIQNAYSEMKFTLYGFKIGQNINAMKKELGKPHDVYKFEDGFVAYIYQFKGYNVIFETDKSRPDIIYSIQIQGKTNPDGLGLDSVNLGDTFDKAVKALGKADTRNNAIDSITKKEMKDTVYYDYNKTGNYSYESVGNTISSIKIAFNGINSVNEDAFAAYSKFISAVKTKNYYAISNYLTASTVVYWNGEYKIDTSVFGYLQKNKSVNNAFFNARDGIMSFEKSNLKESALRLMDNGLKGMVFKITKDKVNYEIFFIKTFEGWVISYINKLK